MSRIRSKNTQIEEKMAASLDERGLEYRRYPALFGRPDFLVGGRIVVFCDGDFWHGYRMGTNPRLQVTDNREFWMEKIRGNRLRDRRVNRFLRDQGLVVLRFWEHDLRKNSGRCAEKVRKALGDIGTEATSGSEIR
jgi:DNA mismatch endonuclease, patch repair protein